MVAPGNFGIRVRIVEFVPRGREGVEKNFLMEATTVSPMTDHAAL